MGFRLRATGEYFPTDFALRDHFGGTVKVRSPVTPEWMEDHGIDPVFEGPQASGGTVYQYSQAAGIEQVDGKWYTKYILGPVFTGRPATDTEPAQTAAEQEAAYKTAKDEEQAKSVRTSRNDKLKECDWTQISDATVNKYLWAAYRQALRDVTAQVGFPWNVDWPTQPE
jgi:hypothetical protein